MTQTEPITPAESLQSIVTVGEALRVSFSKLLDAIAGDPGPTALSRQLGVNRVIVSKLVNALQRHDPLAVMQHIPGPNSLRNLVAGAESIVQERAIITNANDATDRFADLIRVRFGTRGALDAAISAKSEHLLKRYEEASRYDVFNGMRHVLGVQAETWLTAMLFSPSEENDRALSITTLHGALAMRRLRLDTQVRFTFGPPYSVPGAHGEPVAKPIVLDEFCENQPAKLETERIGGQLHHRLVSDTLGKDSAVDMLVVSHLPNGSRRYGDAQHKLSGAAVFPDIPVRTLHVDAIVHNSLFVGTAPELIVYNPGARGPANPNDPDRDIDRIPSTERLELAERVDGRFVAPGVSNYHAMLERVFASTDQDPEDFRIIRVRVPYPVHGFQYVLAFPVGLGPEG